MNSECNAEDLDFDMRSACGFLMRGALIKIVLIKYYSRD